MIKNITVLTLLIFNISLSSTYFVPGDFGSIQEAIDESANGDSIFVDPGIYFENINFNGKSIILSSRYILDSDSLLIGTTIIDAGSDGSVVSFNSEENSSSILQGLHFKMVMVITKIPMGMDPFILMGVVCIARTQTL